MDGILVLGASGHARVVMDIARCQGRFHIVGVLDRELPVGSAFVGVPVLGRDEDLPNLTRTQDIQGLVVAIGDNFRRAQVVASLASLCPGLPLVTLVHPTATVAGDVSLGPGTVVMAGAVVNPGAHVGRGCILNTKASLDHDSSLGDFASLAPGATVGGGCRIGARVAIGIGATLSHGIEVGEDAVVGAGALVLRSVEALTLVHGVPARRIRIRQAGESYL